MSDHSQHSDHSEHSQHSRDDHGSHQDHHRSMIRDFQRRLAVSAVLTVPILLLAPLIQKLLGLQIAFAGDDWLRFGLASAVFFYGGWPFLSGAVSELRDRNPGMMTLIGLAISVAYLYSSGVVFGLPGKTFYWELATLIDVMLLGHWIEMRSILGASRSLEMLAEMLPSEARVQRNGEFETIPQQEIQAGDLVLVRPGETIPSDGTVEEGRSSVNESMLTGEATPVSRSEGDRVIAGSSNGEGALQIRVNDSSEDSYLSKVIRMVQEAQGVKSRTQRLADRAARALTFLALSAGGATLGVWLWLGRDFVFALERMVTVMVISCPHALGLAIPLVAAISTAQAAKNGLLIRNRTAFESARKISVIVFDKTGTLTTGEFGVQRVGVATDNLSENDLLALAGAVEQNSEHPLAEAIVAQCKARSLELPDARDFGSATGKGVQARVNQEWIEIVSPGVLEERGLQRPQGADSSGAETVVFVLRDNVLAGWIALADAIRPESREAIATLQNAGVRAMMATGDNERTARAVYDELGLDGFYAGVLPDHKQSIVKKLQDQGEFVAMTGDGVNDAPALAQADVGIAVGSGTDVAAETADIILVESNPRDIQNLILFGRATYRKMLQNLFWAAAYNVAAIPLAAGVLYSWGIMPGPAPGAAFMSLSTVIVAANAQLLKRSLA